MVIVRLGEILGQVSSHGHENHGIAGVLIAVREARSWRVCLPQDEPDLPEHLIEWR